MYLLKIRSEVKNPHISASGVSFAILLWSIDQDMGRRLHFVHMAKNYRLKPHRVRRGISYTSENGGKPCRVCKTDCITLGNVKEFGHILSAGQ